MFVPHIRQLLLLDENILLIFKNSYHFNHKHILENFYEF